MTLDSDIKELKEKVDKIDSRTQFIRNNFSPKERVGLYAMVLITMVNSCNITGERTIQRVIKTELDNRPIAAQVTETPELISQNVFGKEAQESFYEIGGQRAYVQIDGESVEDYMKTPAESPANHN